MSEERIAPADARPQRPKRVKRDVHGWCILDKPVGMTSTHAVSRGEAPVPGEARRPCRHARSAGVRAAADRARRGDQDRSVRDGRAQDLSLHGALGRGARYRRQRRPRHRQQRRAAGARTRSARCCRASPAPSSRSRRATPRSRSTASAPTILRATARSWSSRPPGRHPPAWTSSRRPTPTTACSPPNAAREPMCARSPATWAARSGATATCRRCGAPASARSRKRTRRSSRICRPRRRPKATATPATNCALTALLQPVDAGLRSIPSLGVSRADAARLARGQPVLLRGRDAPIMQGVRRGIDPRRPDRAGRIRAGRIAAAAHFQSRRQRLNPDGTKFFLFFQCLTHRGERCGLDFVAGSYIPPGRERIVLNVRARPAAHVATSLDDIPAWPQIVNPQTKRKPDVDHDRT